MFKFIKMKQNLKTSLVSVMSGGWQGHKVSPSVQNVLLGSTGSAHDNQRDFVQRQAKPSLLVLTAWLGVCMWREKVLEI